MAKDETIVLRVIDPTVPDTDEALAKKTIREMAMLVFGPTDNRTKIAAAAQILPYTKAKPAQKSEVAISGPEEWLKNAIADNERAKR